MHLEYFYAGIGFYNPEKHIDLKLLSKCNPIREAFTSNLWDTKLIIKV